MLVKKTDLPFMNKGRWYTFFIESTGSTRKITHTDLSGSIIDGSYVKLPSGFREIEILYDVHTVSQSAVTTMGAVRKAFTDGNQGFIMPSASCFDYAYIHVFGYFGD